MLSPMSGRKKGGSDGRAPGGGGYAKSGKPRPGTGGNRRDRLEGKGPTPPAYMRPGHPAQRAAAARCAGWPVRMYAGGVGPLPSRRSLRLPPVPGRGLPDFA